MKVVIQNLHKLPHLGTDLVEEYDPDVLLVQEINLKKEREEYFSGAYSVQNYKVGLYGTAIYGKNREELTNVRHVTSPHSEAVWFVYKHTTLAEYEGVDFVSFHGYNGLPLKSISKLLDHVRAVIKKIRKTGPAVFAGDFNTWTKDHVQAVVALLRDELGFRLAHSWPYPRLDTPLDHLFLRDLEVESLSEFRNKSDHGGLVAHLRVTIDD